MIMPPGAIRPYLPMSSLACNLANETLSNCLSARSTVYTTFSVALAISRWRRRRCFLDGGSAISLRHLRTTSSSKESHRADLLCVFLVDNDVLPPSFVASRNHPRSTRYDLLGERITLSRSRGGDDDGVSSMAVRRFECSNVQGERFCAHLLVSLTDNGVMSPSFIASRNPQRSMWYGNQCQ